MTRHECVQWLDRRLHEVDVNELDRPICLIVMLELLDGAASRSVDGRATEFNRGGTP